MDINGQHFNHTLLEYLQNIKNNSLVKAGQEAINHSVGLPMFQKPHDELQQAINDRYTQQLINDNNIDTKIAKWIYGLYGDDSFDRLENK